VSEAVQIGSLDTPVEPVTADNKEDDVSKDIDEDTSFLCYMSIKELMPLPHKSSFPRLINGLVMYWVKARAVIGC